MSLPIILDPIYILVIINNYTDQHFEVLVAKKISKV